MGSIAVVIPTYNRLYALRETVPRYCALPEVERVIVVDDASSDGTRRWLADAASELDRLAVRRHDARRGSAASRNTGLRAARSLPVDRVLTVDDDILPGRPDAVALLQRALDEAGADLASPMLVGDPEKVPEPSPGPPSPPEQDSTSRRLWGFGRILLERWSNDELARGLDHAWIETPLGTGIMLVEREVAEAVAYDEGLGWSGYRDDTDFQLKAREAGFRLVVVPPAVMHDIRVPGDTGGCHSLGPLAYELEACRNNWRVLSRHRAAVEELTGRSIWLLQGGFLVYRLAVKLPARVIRRLRYHVSTRPGGR